MSLYTTEISLFFFYKLFEKIYFIIEKLIKKLFPNILKKEKSIFDIILLILSFFLFKYGYEFSTNEYKKINRRYIFCIDLIPINSSLVF